MAERGTELEDLRVIINEIDAALCQYCNEADDPYTPPSDWDASCEAAFRGLCDAYNNWHANHATVGKISTEYWDLVEGELAETQRQLRYAQNAVAWRPIETAPKDGTRVLAWWDFECMAIAYWSNEGGFWTVDLSTCDEPTHWMPLPAPPAPPDHREYVGSKA